MRSLAFASFFFQSFLFPSAYGFNFPYEAIQLTDADVANHPELRFGSAPYTNNATCKTFPEDKAWPSNSAWAQFNKTLGGVLIKPTALAAPCYAGYLYNREKCAYIIREFNWSGIHNEDPTDLVTSWTQGNGCLPTLNPNSGICTLAGYPAYVVNATTAKQIQMAVNFARNNNLRLVIKNTGHDFLGRSAGEGALSIWTHYLKAFEYLPKYGVGDYYGKAARVGAGVQSFDLQRYMYDAQATVIHPGGSTVGAYGGFTQAGGHSLYTSYYGLGSDQVLSIEVITADGRLITADPDTNEDLFWAIRGGGGGTFGVVTSMVVKVYDITPIAISNIAFSTGGPAAVTTEAFWEGVEDYFKYALRICDEGGIGYNFVRNGANGTLTFTTAFEMPGMEADELQAFVRPLIRRLNEAGINITNPRPYITGIPTARNQSTVLGDQVSNNRLATRLIPRDTIEDDDDFGEFMDIMRAFVEEGGYIFHGINYSPTNEVAGYPGRNSAVNPAFRRTVLHAEGWGIQPELGTPEQVKQNHDRFNRYYQPFRDLTPDGGSYMNEADVDEPGWQHSFYGHNYPRLLKIKKQRDPWDLFYTTTGVGSEDWVIETPFGLKSQNGRLCKAVGGAVPKRDVPERTAVKRSVVRKSLRRTW